MDLLQVGHAGARVIVFPSSMGRFFEWEDRGMIAEMGSPIEQGWFQFWCVDSVDDDSWYAKWKRPEDRAVRQAQYDAYVHNEVLPLTRRSGGSDFCITTGASFGAYHAMSFGLRHPWEVNRILGLSGLYDIREQTGGWSNETLYFLNPSDFVLGEESDRLDAIRRQDIIFAIGETDPMRGGSDDFSRRLATKGIPHAYRVWDGWAHDWPYWRQMLARYIGGSA